MNIITINKNKYNKWMNTIKHIIYNINIQYIINRVQVLFIFRFVACFAFRFSFHFVFLFLANVHFLFSGMFVWVERKSRARGLWGFFFFVACAGGGGVYRTPNGLVHILIPEKIKNKIPKKKKFENQKFKNWKKKKSRLLLFLRSCFLWNFRFKAIFLLCWYKCPLCW